MYHRQGIISRSLVLWFLYSTSCVAAEKLSPDQKAPAFARGSGGLILKTPYEGEQRFGAGAGGGGGGSSKVDGVEREETETYKTVDGELVRTVEGHFSYQSPEGLPVYVKYNADENGNKASFKFGKAVGGGTGETGGTGGTRGTGSGSGTGGQPPGGGPVESGPYPPSKNVGRGYLPPE